MYSINGFNLDNPALGLTVLDSSDLTAGAALTRPSLTRPGIDGSVPMPGTLDTPVLGIAIGCNRPQLDLVKAVFLQPVLNLGRAGTYGTAAAQLKSLTDTRVTGGIDYELEVKAVLELPGVWFRGELETFTLGPGFLSPVMELRVFPGISGKVTDALVRVRDVTNVTVADAAGSFIRYTGTVPADSALRIDTATGRGWLSAPDAWTGGTEVDPLALSFGKGPGFLAITPSFTDPSDRAGVLTITVDDRGGSATAAVRGRNAYNA